MFAAYVVVTIVTSMANACFAAADLAKARFVLANMDKVRVPRSWLTALGLLKAAGAAGLLIGLAGARPLGVAGVRPLGVAAAIGLVLFFTGALATHVRARVFCNIAYPGTLLALAVASAVLAITCHGGPGP